MPKRPVFLSILLCAFGLSSACGAPTDGLYAQGEVSYSTAEFQSGFRLDRLTRLSLPDDESPAGRLAGECTTSEGQTQAFLGRTANAPDAGGLVSMTITDTEELGEVQIDFEDTDLRLSADECATWDIRPDGDLLTLTIECSSDGETLTVDLFFEGCL